MRPLTTLSLLLLSAGATTAAGPLRMAAAATPGSAGLAQPPFASLERIAAGAIRVGCSAARDTVTDPQAAASLLYPHMGGFAKLAGVTGGRGKPVLTVTNLQDYARGTPPVPGSLRNALAEAGRQGGGWIRFDPALGPKPTIRLVTGIRPPSNVTIDGGWGVELQTTGTAVVVLERVSNIVLTRLRIDQQPGPGEARVGDCITVGGNSDRVWIAYNDIGHCGDGLIDVTKSQDDAQPSRVTISNNVLHDHDKAMLLATLDCSADKSLARCNVRTGPRDWRTGVQVTLTDNLFLRTGQRNPKVFGVAYAHAADNILLLQATDRGSGRTGALYGSFASEGGRLLVEDGLVALDRTRPVTALWAGLASPQDPNAGGAMRVRDVQTFDNRVVDSGLASLVPDPPYPDTGRHALPADPAAAIRLIAGSDGPCGLA